MSIIPAVRAISESDMRALLARKFAARCSYDAHLASRDTVWRDMESAYESKRAVLWGDWVEAATAVVDAGL